MLCALIAPDFIAFDSYSLGHCCQHVTLDFGRRAIGWVGRRDGLGRAQHHAHQRVFVADVGFFTVDADGTVFMSVATPVPPVPA